MVDHVAIEGGVADPGGPSCCRRLGDAGVRWWLEVSSDVVGYDSKDLLEPMDAESTEPTTDAPESISRRNALAKLGLAAGVVGAPIVLDTFVSPAGAQGTGSGLLCNNPVAGQVTVPAGRALFFDVAGGGGGGGSQGYSQRGPAGSGGPGARITGNVAALLSSYTVTIAVGTGGAGAPQPTAWNGNATSGSLGGAGGTGYRVGGAGGRNGPGNVNGDGGGGGGGGGGASALTGTGITVIAGGGGGGGGGAQAQGVANQCTSVPPATADGD